MADRRSARLRCLRGIDTLTAVGLCAEIGDFERFARAEQLMSYVGLVPSEHTTGQQRRLGAITKTGSGHARRLLVEAAWHYRPRPAHRQGPRRAPGRPARRSDRDRLERATTPAPHLEPARSSAPSAAPSSPSPPPANSPASAGRSPASNNPTAPHTHPVGWVGGGPATRGEPATAAMSNPPHPGRPRPISRQRHPTTNHGPAATRTREYQPDRASRTAPPDRHPPSRPHHPTTSANAPTPACPG